MVGSELGAYRIVRELGRGGMGAVYLGEHSLLGRQAAIKVLLPEMSVNRANVERFFNEARATTAVSDPGIVQVFDFGFTADNTAYIVMELLDGEQLNERLYRLGRLEPLDAIRIVRQIAGSLAAAHTAGIIHRDLKPENLFIVPDPSAPRGERVKILDFGIAKLDDNAAPDRSKTRTGAILGTPSYMSPEQCKSSADVDHRTDIYSLGCVLFHLLTGKPPFDLQSTAELIIAHVSTASPAPKPLVPSLARDLDTVVARCMAKAPRDRYATMQELAAACDALLARPSAIDLTIHAAGGMLPRVTVPAEPPRTTRGKRPAIAIWVGSIVLAASGGIAIAIATAGGAHLQVPAAATAPAGATAPPAVAPPPAIAPPPAVANVPTDAAPETATVAPPGGSNTPTGASQSGKHGSASKRPKPGKGKPSDSGDLYDDR